VQFSPHRLFLQAAAEVLDVALHFGTDKGIDAGGGEPLKLAELRKDAGAGGDKRFREKLLGQFCDSIFVAGVEVGVEEANGDGFYPGILEFQDGGAGGVFVRGVSTCPRGSRRSGTTLRSRRFTKGRACQGISCMME
jgi:hypothetical protein